MRPVDPVPAESGSTPAEPGAPLGWSRPAPGISDAPDISDTPAAGSAEPWRRLDPRVLLVVPIKQLGALVPVIVVLLVGGRGQGGWQLSSAVLPVVAVLAVGVLRWSTVRYRVGPERVQLRTGLLRRAQRSVRRDRVRTVDLRASLAHRWFGLTSVEIGTGTGGGSTKSGRLSLDGVRVAEGERLRRELLDRSSVPAAGTSRGPSRPVPAPERSEPVGVPVARLHLSWLRYAPLTTSGLVAVAAVVGTVFKVANDAGVNLADTDTVQHAGAQLSAIPLWMAVVLLVLVVLVISTVGSLAVYAEGWWRYRLSREPDGTLRLSRGLLTTRSLSIEQRRVRGAEVTEPLPLRLAGGGRCAAVTTGLDNKATNRGTLLPPAPLAQAHRVAREALRLAEPAQGTESALIRHPLAALRRRMTRAVLPALVFLPFAWWLGDTVSWLAPLWPLAVLAVPSSALLAADRYRNLGHILHREHLVIRYGSLVRRTVALQRGGIIGWRLRQSPPQRWAGVLTLDAITAAGAGRYSVVDIAPARALELVNQITPHLWPGLPQS